MSGHRESSESPRQSVLARLVAGTAVFGLGIRNARTAEIVRIARIAGFGLVWIDLEHSTMSIDCAAQIAASAWDIGLEAWVRTPEREFGDIGRLLDGGASGIIAPGVETADGARDVVEAARFPPRGSRSRIALLPQTGYRRLAPADLMRAADETTSVHVLLETRLGIENANTIAAIDGVDMLHVGLNDLSTDLGYTGDVNQPEVLSACRTAIDAARRHGKLAVVGGWSKVSMLQDMVRAGASPLLLAAIDTDILAAGLTQRAEEWRAAWPSP